MNKVFSIVWSYSLQAWAVVSEKTTRRGKGTKSIRRVFGAVASAALSSVTYAATPPSNALPSNGKVVAGQIGISQSTNRMDIHQSSQQGIINWQSFNIGSDATVNFIQPSRDSATLNRVTSGGASQILGNLNANGQVFVINPNGVLFGQNARVDVGGLVASSLDIANDDFMARRYEFSAQQSSGAVVNQGELLGRYVALLAPEVRNEGVVIARQGTVAMAAGDLITLSISGDRLIDVQVSKAQFDSLVENRHLIEAEEGLVILSAQSAAGLLGQTVNTGSVSATGIVNDGGKVRLVASSEVSHSGAIFVDGGSHGHGGEAILLASLDNSDSKTVVSGSVSARGGEEAGNGGFVETSANRVTISDSASITTRAANGRTGEWLIDPTDFTIGLNGDIDASTLETQLASSNVTIQSVNGSEDGRGDIFVNEALSWGDNQLTLSADRNIEINAPISVTAGGGLNLEFGQAYSSADFFPEGNYFVSAPVNLASGTHFTTKALRDGIVENYTVITDVSGLRAIESGMSGNYVLGADISVAGTSWNPLGNATADIVFGTTPFTGIFDGLGHTIDGLTRANSANGTGIGLFGQIGDSNPFGAPGGVVLNLGLTNVNLAGLSSVGALAGANYGFVYNVYSTGTVTGSDAVGLSTDDSVWRIGGLVGVNSGLIASSYSAVNVTATTGSQVLGGGSDGGIGGLVGDNAGQIGDSYATGSVSGIRDVGGLVGYNASGTIDFSYASGLVTGSVNTGGLVGDIFVVPPGPFIPPTPDPVFNSYWNVTSSGQASSAGGGQGLMAAEMLQQSSFSGFDFTNTWVMYDGISQPLLRSMLTPYYVTVNEQIKTYDGNAFVGFTATESGSSRPAVITGAISFSGAGTAASNAGQYTVSVSGLGLTDAGKQDQHGYLIKYVDGIVTIERAALTVTASDQKKTYGDSLTLDTNAYTITGLAAGETIGSVTLASAKASDTSTNAGTYADDIAASNASGGTFNQANYDITYLAGDLVVDKRAITVTANNQRKTYGDILNLGSSAFSVANLVAGETIGSVTLTSAKASDGGANAGTYAGDIEASNASGGTFNEANYDITYLAGELRIDKALLTVVADDKKIVIGNAIPALTQTISGFVNGETLSSSDVTGRGIATTSATLDSPVGRYSIASSAGTLASANYTFTYLGGTLTITQAPQAQTPLSGTETAVEIIQDELNKNPIKGAGLGSGGQGVSSTGQTGAGGSPAGAAPGSQDEVIQNGADQFCQSCIRIADSGSQINEDPRITQRKKFVSDLYDHMRAKVQQFGNASFRLGGDISTEEKRREREERFKTIDEEDRRVEVELERTRTTFESADAKTKALMFPLLESRDRAEQAAEDYRKSLKGLDDKKRMAQEAAKQAEQAERLAKAAAEAAEKDPDSVEKFLAAQSAWTKALQSRQEAGDAKKKYDVAQGSSDLKKVIAEDEKSKADAEETRIVSALMENDLSEKEEKEKLAQKNADDTETAKKDAELVALFSIFDKGKKEQEVKSAQTEVNDFSELYRARVRLDSARRSYEHKSALLEALAAEQKELANDYRDDGKKAAIIDQMLILQEMTKGQVKTPIESFQNIFHGRRPKDDSKFSLDVFHRNTAAFSVSQLQGYLDQMRAQANLSNYSPAVDYSSALDTWTKKYQSAIDSNNRIIADLRQELPGVEKEVQEATANLEKVSSEIAKRGYDSENYEEAQQKLSEAREALSKANAAIFTTQARIRSSAEEAENAQKVLGAAKAEADELRAQADQLREQERKAVEQARLASVRRIDESLEFLKDQAEGSERYIAEVELKLEKQNALVEEVKRRKAEWEQKAQEFPVKVVEAQAAADADQKEAVAAKAEFERLDASAKEYDKMLADLGPRQESTEQAWEKAKDKLERAKEALAAIDTDYQQYVEVIGSSSNFKEIDPLTFGLGVIGLAKNEATRAERTAKAREAYETAVKEERQLNLDRVNALNRYNQVVGERNNVVAERNSAKTLADEASVKALNSQSEAETAKKNAEVAKKNVALFSDNLVEVSKYQSHLQNEVIESRQNAKDAREDYEAEKKLYSR